MIENLESAPALFETVRAGDPQKSLTESVNSRISTKASSPLKSRNASITKKDEYRVALRNVLFQSVQDNESVERRIILEREITERHQLVVIDLNGAANKLYKELSHGALSRSQEERLGLQKHNSASNSSSTHATEKNTTVTTLLQSLTEQEKNELRSLLQSDTRLVASLVDVYKEEREKESMKGITSAEGKPTKNNHDIANRRSLVVQSMIASMQNVLPADMLLQLNPNPTAPKPKASAQPIHNELKHNNKFEMMNASVESITHSLPLYTPTRSPVISAKQIADSIHTLYKTFADYYKRLRTTEAHYLIHKLAKETKFSDRGKNNVLSPLSSNHGPLIPNVISIEKVTPSSIILVSFFTRLLNLDDPLTRSNYLDALLSSESILSPNDEVEEDFVIKNEFYQLPRLDRTREFSRKNVRSDGTSDYQSHLEELCAAATELGTLLMDEATQVVTEYPSPPLPYYAYGPLGKYMKEQDVEAQKALLEKEIQQRAENELQQSLLLSTTDGGGNTINTLGSLVLASERKRRNEEISLISPSSVAGSPITPTTCNNTHNTGLLSPTTRVSEADGTFRPQAKQLLDVYPCSFDAVDALPYTAFTSYVRSIAGALYPDRSNLVSSQLLAMTLLRRVHVLLL